MKKRIISLVIILLSLALAMYIMRMVNLHSSWFGTSMIIEITSVFLFYFIPILMIVSFFRKLTKIVAGTTIFILGLSLTYGFYFEGYRMLSMNYYLNITIICLMPIICLAVVIYKQVQNNND